MPPADKNWSRHQQDWEELARLDPMWAVLSHPDMSRNRWDESAFYDTGRKVIEGERKTLESLGLPSSFDRVLDFGCGLGRLTYAWAPYARECVGVDISESMVAQAAEKARASNCRFIHNERPDLTLFEDASFDMVHTLIVLQHIPSRDDIETYLREFIRVTRPGGVIYFQLPSGLPVKQRIKVRRYLYHFLMSIGFKSKWLYEKFTINPMKMNHIPVERVLEVMGEQVRSVKVQDSNPVTTTYIFQKPD
ncbi:MAG: class I SAM-dependent methyltransferase [Candidatus Sumerlaeia bacterium]|nr:class I SAM-dependent methyltransferase [Candidatus Sumerlaeia bacterium]